LVGKKLQRKLGTTSIIQPMVVLNKLHKMHFIKSLFSKDVGGSVVNDI
jgi:hypothetical protein